MYRALLDEVGTRMLAAIVAATSDAPDGRSQTEAGFAAYFRWVAEDHAAFLLLYGGGSRRDEEFSRAVRRVTAGIAQTIAPLIAADIDAEHRLHAGPRPRRPGRGCEPAARRARRRLRPRRDRHARSPSSPGPVCVASTAAPDAVRMHHGVP